MTTDADDFLAPIPPSAYPEFKLDAPSARALIRDVAMFEDIEPGEIAVDDGFIRNFLGYTDEPAAGVQRLLDVVKSAIIAPEGWRIAAADTSDPNEHSYELRVYPPESHVVLTEGYTELSNLLLDLPCDEDGLHVQTVDGLLRLAQQLIGDANQVIAAAFKLGEQARAA